MNNTDSSLVSEWNLFVNNNNYNLIEKCLKLAQILEYPELNITNEIEKIKELGLKFRDRIVESKNPTYTISLLNSRGIISTSLTICSLIFNLFIK